MKRIAPLALAIALSVMSVVACSVTATEDAREADNALGAQDFDATVRQLTALTYLPWAYTTDGCSARAFYYSMVLATKGVPTNHVYAVARTGTKLGGIWDWHVAPLVTKDSDAAHLFVLDPVFEKTRALTIDEWVSRQNYSDPSAADYPKLVVFPGNSFDDALTTSGGATIDDPAAPVVANYKEPTFASMPAFDLKDVILSCWTMHDYIDLEPGIGPTEKGEKHLMLSRETKRLVDALAAMGKLDGDPARLHARCAAPDVAELDAGPGDAGSAD